MSEFAGSLTERVEFWEHLPMRSAAGASSSEFRFKFSCRAAIVAEGVGAASEAMALSAMARFRVAIRPQPELKFDQQLRWRGKRLLIQQILDDPRHPDRLTIRCEEQR